MRGGEQERERERRWCTYGVGRGERADSLVSHPPVFHFSFIYFFFLPPCSLISLFRTEAMHHKLT